MLHARFAVFILSGKKSLGMGIPSQSDYLLDSIRIAHVVFLGEYADLLRQLGRLVAADILSFQRDAAGVGRALRNGMDERALSSAVRAGQHQPLSLLQMKGEIVDNCLLAVAHSYMIGLQHCAHLAFLVR